MDIDGPEFLSNVNQEIASIRATRTNDTTIHDHFFESIPNPSTGKIFF